MPVMALVSHSQKERAMPNPIVADLSHYSWNGTTLPDFSAAAASGVFGIIYKASQGATVRDSTYAQSRALAEKAGLLWGAYHFGTNAAAKAQADNFLLAADPAENTLVCLDFEKNGTASITLPIAMDFLHEVEKRLGRKPKLYTGSYMYDLFGQKPCADLAPYSLWWARYAETPQVHPTWADYWLWQYTDGHNGPAPHSVAGLGSCDLDHFDGTQQDLIVSWT